MIRGNSKNGMFVLTCISCFEMPYKFLCSTMWHFLYTLENSKMIFIEQGKNHYYCKNHMCKYSLYLLLTRNQKPIRVDIKHVENDFLRGGLIPQFPKEQTVFTSLLHHLKKPFQQWIWLVDFTTFYFCTKFNQYIMIA